MKTEQIDSTVDIPSTLLSASTAGFSTFVHNRASKDEAFISMACVVAQRSPDPHRQVGAVAVTKEGLPIAFAYNGLEPGVDDAAYDWTDRKKVRKEVRHAEHNLVLFGGDKMKGSTVYVTLKPCEECETKLRKAGVRRVVYRVEYVMPSDAK